MFFRFYRFLIDSFKPLLREKTSLMISSFTIGLCLIIISIICSFSFYTIAKIITINDQEISVIFSKKIEDTCMQKCNDEMLGSDKNICPECAIYNSEYLIVYDEDLALDKKGKIKCKECCDQEGFIDGSRIISFKCDNACTPYDQSNYPEYYGSKISNPCKDCLDNVCDEANNQVLVMYGVEERLESIYKEEILRIWEEDLMEQNYFSAPYRGPMINLPMGGNFRISDEINTINELDEMISNIERIDFVDYVDTNFDEFIYYRKLIPIIITFVSMTILIAFTIPFFIISNTIRLIIHSKRNLLYTLRILGEKDFYIKLPFVLQGVWQGLIGGVLAVSVLKILSLIGFNDSIYRFLNIVIKTADEIDVNIVNFPLIVVIILGILLGGFGALKSASKYLR